MNTTLSDRVKELIAKSRIISFATWKDSHPPEVIQLFQAADDEGRYLTDADLQQIQHLSPHTSDSIEVARLLRDKAAEIVVEAREQVLAAYPEITQPGGGLYPSARAENCWRDFWHFLRCITYGIAGGSTEYTSSEGLHAMQLLYQELAVPLNAMMVGLNGIKVSSLQRVEASQQATLAPYFDHLINQLSRFKPS